MFINSTGNLSSITIMSAMPCTSHYVHNGRNQLPNFCWLNEMKVGLVQPSLLQKYDL